MKTRIKIDSTFLLFIFVLTGFLIVFEGLYWKSHLLDNAFDCFGLVLIIKGILLRMSARGHKKRNSKKSVSLVKTGPYKLIRNPMYLGSFLIGVGFSLIIWPWWLVPPFTLLFYLRFNEQVVIEEVYLNEIFGDEFRNYCKRVPRYFPSWEGLHKIKTKEIYNLEDAFSTKEKRGLLGWPMLAIVLENFQEMMVYGITNTIQTLIVFMITIIIFIIGFTITYNAS